MSAKADRSHCNKCSEPVHYANGTMCMKHNGLMRMRSCAKEQGKYVPSLEELESMLARLKDFRCTHCGVKMNWRRENGSKTVITLQHDRVGNGIRFFCMSCNARHMKMPGDSYYHLKSWSKALLPMQDGEISSGICKR